MAGLKSDSKDYIDFNDKNNSNSDLNHLNQFNRKVWRLKRKLYKEETI